MWDFLGNSVLTKLQKAVLTVIKKGGLNNLVCQLLSRRELLDQNSINYTYPIPIDTDPVNKQKRINFYEKLR